MTVGIGAADAAIYTGVCLDNNDPLKLGRIRFCVPQLSGTASFGWASPAYPGSTPVGATVYVAFEGGDRNRPIFWPDQSATSAVAYPTYAAMIAANPVATTPLGTTFYVTDHGGSAQLQGTGLASPAAAWQFLPNGYQFDSNGGAQVVAGFRANAYLLNFVGFDNPSTKRIYRASAQASFYCDSAPLGVGVGILFGTTSPPSTITSSTVWDAQNSSYITAVDTSGLIHTPVNTTAIKSGLPLGTTYCASYIIYLNTNDTPNIWTYPSGGGSGYRNLFVEDIGAVV